LNLISDPEISGNMAVTVSSGKTGPYFNPMLKNQNNTAYHAKVVVGIANI
jgi:hypothetical protein